MMTREKLEAKLDQAVADGSMTPEDTADFEGDARRGGYHV